MENNIFEKWNNSIDTDGLQKDIAEAEANSGHGEYREVPVGTYEIKIEKLEMKASSKGSPMVSAMFRILEGEYAKSCLFMNQVITQGFQIGIVNDFLRSLGTSDDVTFVDFAQYNNLIMDIMEKIDGNFEYLLEYSKSKKDFAQYKIKEVYELEG